MWPRCSKTIENGALRWWRDKCSKNTQFVKACYMHMLIYFLNLLHITFIIHSKVQQLPTIEMGRVYKQTNAQSKSDQMSNRPWVLARDDCTQSAGRAHAHIKHASSIKHVCSPRHFISDTSESWKPYDLFPLDIITINCI